MNKLGIKLLIVFLVISLGGLSLTGFLINRSINNNFIEYLNNKREETDKQIVQVIEELYQSKGRWSEVLSELMNLDFVSRVVIRIKDTNGNIVYSSFETRRRFNRPMMMRGMQGMMMNHQEEIESFVTREYPLMRGEEQIGNVYISSLTQRGLLTPRDQYFKSRVNKAIFWAAGLIALITSLVSLYFSRLFTRPLTEISRATERIAQGNYSQRVKVLSKDEIGKLSISFNEMARKLEKLEKIRKETTSDLAHELRTPLSTMRSYLEAMEDGIIPASKENLSSLHSELMRLVRLVDQLGQLAEVEKKSINHEKEKINISKVVLDVGKRYLPFAREKNIDFIINIKNDYLYILGDKDSIEQIFSNLFSNAVKYTDKGGEVKVNVIGKKDKVVVIIKDNGIGIPDEDLPYIFERFYRADKSRSRESGGTGIGLTITKELVKAHGGEIAVDSNLGEGTEFTITFPLSHSL